MSDKRKEIEDYIDFEWNRGLREGTPTKKGAICLLHFHDFGYKDAPTCHCDITGSIEEIEVACEYQLAIWDGEKFKIPLSNYSCIGTDDHPITVDPNQEKLFWIQIETAASILSYDRGYINSDGGDFEG